MIDFSQPYHRDTFLDFLQNGFLPDDFVSKTSDIELDSFTPRFAQQVYKLGSCPSLELDVYEVTHTSTHDARVGIAHDAFKLMLNYSYNNRALVVFVPEHSNQYRFSLLEIEANQEDNSARIQLSYSNPRRYSFLLGHDTQIKTPTQFLLEKGRIRKVDGSYVKDLQNRFSVEVLTKQFYRELSNWYFWAIKQVTFPSQPTPEDALAKNVKLDDLILEHNATNVIRLLTRILFVWFVKEKKLIPEELFHLDTLQQDILNGMEPYHQNGLFNQVNRESVYYKAILQNLFFATLNCPIKADKVDKSDKRSRRFRLNNFYGQDFGVDWLYRYEKYFKNSDAFEKLMSTIPFLNGGLFECLDRRGEKEKQEERIWVDGFSDNLNKPHQLIVPDYLFFGLEEVADLSEIVGIKDKQYRQAAVKGLINILKTYNFTVEENTPAEIEVALDPELLGKVFENLLASYNPETKTTARKQTGSFYTPREIVNYMVDESLMAYLKTRITHWGNMDEKSVDRKLQALFSFNGESHFEDNPRLQREIINALSTCTILDPACGSGAFPMGALQKMVHILRKLDPQNEIWKQVQLERAVKESEAAFEIEDRDARRKYLLEIESTFDKTLNDPDYARKLYLIENCIYGVDIQPIATQISKLRFFISLVVDQKSNDNPAQNFGIRSLPNLETKFVTANTLIGVSKPNAQLNLFETAELQELEGRLKRVRSKLFNARTKETKQKYRQEDKRLRMAIADEMVKLGYPTQSAQMLARWDPYDQNASSPFFDPEWMFDIKEGFDVVIGNPPYKEYKLNKSLANDYKTNTTNELYSFFFEKSISHLLKCSGVISFITGSLYLKGMKFKPLRDYLLEFSFPLTIENRGDSVFENVQMPTCIYIGYKLKKKWELSDFIGGYDIIKKIEKKTLPLKMYVEIQRGFEIGRDKVLESKTDYPFITGSDIMPWQIKNIRYIDVDTYDKYSKNETFYLLPRVLIRETGSALTSLFINQKLYCNRSLYSMISKKGYDSETLKYINFILNSEISQYYYSIRFRSETDIFPKIRIGQAKELPIRKLESIPTEISLISDFITKLHLVNKIQTTFFKTIANSIVYELYFPEEIKSAGKEILKHLGDLKPITDDMSEEEKLTIIQSEYERLSHAEHPVKQAMDTLEEVEEVRIIREALKSR